ncbi:MAG: surface-adhesin E family protein [Roseococcus sp.]
MSVARLGILGFALVMLAGCETLAPQAAPPVPEAPRAAAPAPVAAPTLALSPRRAWRPIPLSRGARMAQAYVASEIVTNPDGTRRVWMVINLLEPIRLPETGGYARSAAYLADFRCDPHAWHPIQGVWYTQRNAVGEALREQQRGPDGIRDVGEGSFVDIFVHAACDSPGRATRRSAR